MAILKIKDENGNFINIPSIKGNKGEKGDTGLTGQAGADGKDGYTPVRGTDYWTEEDKNEIKSYCDSLITGALGGSY